LASGQIVLSAQVVSGKLKVGDIVRCCVDSERRLAICKNHSACHILQKTLQEVLGPHVAQAGSYVDDKRLRFDFSHFTALSPELLTIVQAKVNEIIFAEYPVEIVKVPLEEAKKIGAMALFENKYAANVRVCSVGNYSIELCGGTHVTKTSQINMFKIISESSAAAGIRRIEATTAANVLSIINHTDKMLASIAKELKANNPGEIEKRLSSFLKELKDTNDEIKKLTRQKVNTLTETLVNTARDLGDTKILARALQNVKPSELKDICDGLKERLPNAIIVVSATDTKNLVVVHVVGTAREKYNAATILKQICEAFGGNGGGNAKLASGSVAKTQGFEDIVLATLERGLIL
jgi:alanyl-tRNA synthetase